MTKVNPSQPTPQQSTDAHTLSPAAQSAYERIDRAVQTFSGSTSKNGRGNWHITELDATTTLVQREIANLPKEDRAALAQRIAAGDSRVNHMLEMSDADFPAQSGVALRTFKEAMNNLFEHYGVERSHATNWTNPPARLADSDKLVAAIHEGRERVLLSDPKFGATDPKNALRR